MKKLLLLISTLVLFLAACGQKAADESVVKIGVIAPLTGDLAQYGVAAKDGLQLKVDEINAAGGVNGKQIQLIIEDNRGDINESVSIFKKLKGKDNVHLIVGPVISSTSNEIGRASCRERV